MNLLPIIFTRAACAFCVASSLLVAGIEFATGGDAGWPLATALWCGAYWIERENAVKFCAELQALADLVRKEEKS